MSFGFGFGFTKITAAIRAAFSPSSLFAANEPGVWYDPSDLSTLFQDSAGTTPVTAVEQPVGLMLDKSKGLVMGPELVTNGEFDSPYGWLLSAGFAIANSKLVLTAATSGTASNSPEVAAVPGKLYLLTFTIDSISGGTIRVEMGGNSNAIAYSTPGTYTRRVVATDTRGARIIWNSGTVTAQVDAFSVRELPGNHAYQTTATSRPVLSARVNQYLATETLATQDVTTLAAQYRLSFEGTGTITLSGTATGVYSAGSHLITCTAGTLTSTVSGSVTKADLRVANTGVNLPPYQRVNTATDYDTVGFPHYLRFDGVDDGMVTNTITPGIDRVQVFAGAGKLSDALSTVIETSASISTFGGSILLTSGVSSRYRFSSKGTVISDALASVVSATPSTEMLTLLGDISGDRATLRINGVQAAQNTADQGTGNYLAYPLYIGRRGGTTFPFNGHLYSLIVRFGDNLPIETIEKTEKYINQKTRAY